MLIIRGADAPEKVQMTLEQAAEYARELIAKGEGKSDAAKLAAKESGLKKGDIYKLII